MHEGCMKQDSEPIPGADEIRPENLESLTDSDERRCDAATDGHSPSTVAQAHCCALLLRFPNNKAPKLVNLGLIKGPLTGSDESQQRQ